MSGAILNTTPCSMGGAHEPFSGRYFISMSRMILQRTGDPSIFDTYRTPETLEICTKCHSLLFTPQLMPMVEVVKRLPHVYMNITETGPELLDLTERSDARALQTLQAGLASHIMEKVLEQHVRFWNLG